MGSPSLPNYVGLLAGSTFGIGDDAGPSSHPITADNLLRQVRAIGKTERTFAEQMPGRCATGSSRLYAVKHNPAAYFVGADDRRWCGRDDIPLTTDSLQDLPSFALIVPDLCDDTHDCPTSVGDRWLSEWVPPLTATASYQEGRTAIVIAYDEYTPIPNVIMSASVRPGTLTTPINHYALLRATEEMLGIRTYLGGAATAPDIRPALNL